MKTKILADFQICISLPLISWSKTKNFTDYNDRPVEIRKILGGLGVYQKLLANLVGWLRRLLTWNCLKCPEIINRLEVGNVNSQHK